MSAALNTVADFATLVRRHPRSGAANSASREIGIADTELSVEEARLLAWLDAGRHGEMDYMARHGVRRARPAELVPGTLRVISARLDYLPPDARARPTPCWPTRARHTSRAMRSAATTTRSCASACSGWPSASRDAVGDYRYRVFTDSAPVLEVALAAKAGLGWRGKHTLLLTREAGSFFFLGEIYTDLPLPVTPPATRALRQLPRVSRRVPDRRDRRALRTRRAPLHLVSDHRAQRQHSGGLAAR